jgi:hypothetical protein
MWSSTLSSFRVRTSISVSSEARGFRMTSSPGARPVGASIVVPKSRPSAISCSTTRRLGPTVAIREFPERNSNALRLAA